MNIQLNEDQQQELDQLNAQINEIATELENKRTELAQLTAEQDHLRTDIARTKAYAAELRMKSLFRKPLASLQDAVKALDEVKILESTLERVEAQAIEIRQYELPPIKDKLDRLNEERNALFFRVKVPFVITAARFGGSL